MNYFIVPVNDGVLDIDYLYLQEGVQNSETECYVKLKSGAYVRESWQSITEEQFNIIKENLLNLPE